MPNHFAERKISTIKSGISKPRSYTCPTCSTVFKHYCNLKRHQRSQHKGVIRQCIECQTQFSRQDALKRHMKAHTTKEHHQKSHDSRNHQCTECQKSFSRKDALKRHMKAHITKRHHVKSQQGDAIHQCTECQKTFSRNDALKYHMKNHSTKRLASYMPEYDHQRGEGSKSYRAINPPTKSSALRTFFTYTSSPKEDVAYDISVFLKAAKEDIVEQLKEALLENRGVKWYINVNVDFARKITENEEERCTANFRSSCAINLIADPIDDNVNKAIEKVLQSYEEFQGKGSGWIIQRIQFLEIKVAVFKPL